MRCSFCKGKMLPIGTKPVATDRPPMSIHTVDSLEGDPEPRPTARREVYRCSTCRVTRLFEAPVLNGVHGI